MKNKKSVLLIIIGILVISFGVLNFFIDIPGYFSNVRIERDMTASTRAPDLQGSLASTLQPATPMSTATPFPEKTPAYQAQVTREPMTTIVPSTPVEIINGYIPDRIIIPVIQLDAPVVESDQKNVELRDQWFEQWTVPNEFAAGWQASSAPLGVIGNTVLGGHHNEYGKVFEHLIDLQVGDTIYVYSGKVTFVYRVVDKQLLKERDVSLDIRKTNAEWIAPSTNERLTLVTCWPQRSNTHRLIIVAEPVVESQNASLIQNMVYN